MSSSQHSERVVPSQNEEYVTNWPAVIGAVLIVIVFIAGPALLYWQRAQDEAMAQRQAAATRQRDHRSRKIFATASSLPAFVEAVE